jgi:hypothetical protein
MNAAIRAQRERHAAPRTIAPPADEPAPAPAAEAPPEPEAAPPRKRLRDRLLGR